MRLTERCKHLHMLRQPWSMEPMLVASTRRKEGPWTIKLPHGQHGPVYRPTPQPESHSTLNFTTTKSYSRLNECLICSSESCRQHNFMFTCSLQFLIHCENPIRSAGEQRMEWKHGCAGEVWQHCFTLSGVINLEPIKTRCRAAEVTLTHSQPRRATLCQKLTIFKSQSNYRTLKHNLIKCAQLERPFLWYIITVHEIHKVLSLWIEAKA